MIQGKKFISPGAWFTMIYPSTWSEFEDGEGSFLFYNPDVWTGNFRISAFKADAAARGSINYGREVVKQELKDVHIVKKCFRKKELTILLICG